MRSIRLRTLSMYLLMPSAMLACRHGNTPVQQPPLLAIAQPEADLPGREATVPLSWYQLELKLIRESAGFTPPVAARAIAFTGIALHEAMAWEMRDAPAVSGQLSGLPLLPRPDKQKRYNWAIAANSAMADMIRRLFPNASPENLNLVTQLEIDNLDVLADSCAGDVMLRSVNFGRQIAGTIYQWSVAGGGKGGYVRPPSPAYAAAFSTSDAAERVLGLWY